MSHYLVDSEVAIFNRSFTTDPFPLSSETVDLIATANEISRVSNGAFDITVGPFVDAWGFGPKEPPEILPGSKALEELSAFVGYDLLVVDREASTVQKRRKELSVDLSAIAKGHAVDAVAAMLGELGLTDYLVEIGGELRANGNNQQGRPWRVAIEQPDAGQVSKTRIIELRDESIATSGEYRNYYERDGVRVSHTIDPRTGRPVSHELLAVSVIAQYCALADARATALEVLGPAAGYALAIEQGWVALFLIRGEDGRLVERATPTFNQPLE
jgi:thiamine biosynthesis lipoprotein